jgi:hypothetical protein
MCRAMTLIETSRRLGRAERKVLRLQRRLWLAQLAMWPTVIVLAAGLLAAVVWVRRRVRKYRALRDQPSRVRTW